VIFADEFDDVAEGFGNLLVAGHGGEGQGAVEKCAMEAGGAEKLCVGNILVPF